MTKQNKTMIEDSAVNANDSGTHLMQGLGKRLRKLREERGIGVRQLARQINVSASLISHIELGRGAPSVKTLYALINALGVPMSELFVSSVQDTDKDASLPSGAKPQNVKMVNRAIESATFGPVQRGDSRKIIQLEHGFRWECLTPGTEPDVEFLESVIAPGGGNAEAEMKEHNGTEYGLVLEGQLGINIGFDTYTLGPRDSIVFDSTRPHSMWNAGPTPVRSIWFVNRRSKRETL